MLEKYGFYVLALGALLGLIGFIWLVVRAFKAGRAWGLAVVVFPPTALVFIPRRYAQAREPAMLLGLAGLLIATPYALSYYERHYIPLAPYEQVVDGEFRVTLTGIKDFKYGEYRLRPDVAVLQMANADVDDRTLEMLKGLTKLRSLDVSDTQITDAGLARIVELPALTDLRVARTKITDEGFQKHLMPKESLLRLDLTGTEVKGKTKRDWKKLKADVRDYVD